MASNAAIPPSNATMPPASTNYLVLNINGDNLAAVNSQIFLENERLRQQIEAASKYARDNFERPPPPPALSFPKFRDLPVELRLRIWKQKAWGETRVVEFNYFRGDLGSNTGAPAIMTTCRESRDVGMKEYAKLSCGGGKFDNCFVAWDRDIILFKPGSISRFLTKITRDDRRKVNTPITTKDSTALKARKNATIQQVNRRCSCLALTLEDLEDLSELADAKMHLQAVARIYIITDVHNYSKLHDQGLLQLLPDEPMHVLGRTHRQMIREITSKPHTGKTVSVHKATRTKHLLMTETEKDDRKEIKETRMRVETALEREKEQRRLEKQKQADRKRRQRDKELAEQQRLESDMALAVE